MIFQQVVSSKKPSIPTPNMDLLQVNVLNTNRNSYTSKTTQSTSHEQTLIKRPHSVASVSWLFLDFELTIVNNRILSSVKYVRCS